MSTRPSLEFKVATEDREFEQIHQLNYKTFVEEIPQHQPSPTARLVDKFHAENTYLICVCGERLVGMMAVRGRRPFSLDQKLPNLDEHLPAGRHPLEIRLLAVEKDFRTGQVFRGLTALLWRWASERGFDLGVISGTTRQQKLYRHLGFLPFGPLVGKGDALFQPMYLTREHFEAKAEEFFTLPASARTAVNFLPGPVAIHRGVRKAFEQPPQSHRSDDFIKAFQETKQRLCQLVSARKVEILVGSGTLANDAVCAQLSLENKPGLILSNGEFGERLIDHASRFGLTFDTLKFSWGKPFDLAALRKFIARSPALGWVWCPLCETSTGMLNPLAALKQICAEARLKLCLDCMSAIGLAPVNLEGVYLASCASGKGLASYPGLALAFYHHEIAPSPKLPRYLDLGWYARNAGVAFTHSSNLLFALDAAVKRVDWPKKFLEVADTSSWLRIRLRELGFEVVTFDGDAAPGVITIALPGEISSCRVGLQLAQAGYLISYNSDYIRRRNWIQICLMGEFGREELGALINLTHKFCFGSRGDSRKPAHGSPASALDRV